MKAKSTDKPKLPRSVVRAFPQVTSVIDSKRAVTVNVSQKDCDSGKKLKTGECAMALAARKQFKADGAIIALSRSYIIKGNKAIRFQTPVSVARELVSFDRHHDFAEGEYRLSAVTPSARIGKGKKYRSNSNKSTKRHLHQSARVRWIERGSQ